MTHHIYVDDAGTCSDGSGLFSAIQSGGFSTIGLANVYPSVQTAFDTLYASLTDAVINVYLANGHYESTTYTNNSIGLNTSPSYNLSGKMINIWSVDETNVHSRLAGATIATDVIAAEAHADIRIGATNTHVNFFDVNVRSLDQIIIQAGGTGSHVYAEGGEWELKGEGATPDQDSIRLESDGCKLHLNGVALKFSDAGQSFEVHDGTELILNNVSAGVGTTKISDLIDIYTGTGGHYAELTNSNMTGFLADTGSAILMEALSNNDSIRIVGRNLQLHSDTVINGGSNLLANYEFDFSSCDFGGVTGGPHWFYYENDLGKAEFDSAQYLNASYDGGTNKFSVKLTSFADAGLAHPFVYKLGKLPRRDLATADQKINVAITGPASSTTNDIGLIITAPNDTTLALHDSSDTLGDSDVRNGQGTALTADSSAWVGYSDTRYMLEQAIGARTNADNAEVDVSIALAEPSIVVHADLPLMSAV